MRKVARVLSRITNLVMISNMTSAAALDKTSPANSLLFRATLALAGMAGLPAGYAGPPLPWAAGPQQYSYNG